jgi:hypothetical protein
LATRAGLNELANLKELPARFPQTAFVVRRASLRSHKDELTRFFKGYIDGVRFSKENPKRTMEIIAKYTDVTEPELGLENYHAFAPLWEIPPFVSEAGIETALSLSANPKASALTPKDVIDNQIIQALSLY